LLRAPSENRWRRWRQRVAAKSEGGARFFIMRKEDIGAEGRPVHFDPPGIEALSLTAAPLIGIPLLPFVALP
jgi:hypothetical protein